MSTDLQTRSSRRALLATATGGAAALLVDSLARPLSAQAHDPDDVLLGGDNVAESTTILRSPSGEALVLEVESVHGAAISGSGKVTAIRRLTHGSFDFESNRDVVGILGVSQSVDGVGGNAPGVEGRSETGIGVLGGGLMGVHGASGSPGGIGVFAKTETGVALHAFAGSPDQGARAIVAEGPVEFSSSGRGAIASGAARATVPSPVALEAAESKVLVTLLADPAGKKPSALSHVEIDALHQEFTVVLTAPSARKVPFAYFVIN